MSGMALNSELVPLGARFLRSCLMAPSHKLCALAGRRNGPGSAVRRRVAGRSRASSGR